VVISNDPRNSERCLEATGRAVDHQWWTGTTALPTAASRSVAATPGLTVTFGFVSAIKSMDLLHQALERVRASHPGVRWRVIGPFEPRTNPHHADLARRLNADWIEFTGSVSALGEPERISGLLSGAEMMLLPFADGASVRRTTLQAAWAFGLPVVTTPPPVATDAVVDGDNCVLVREPTPEAWADAIGRVLTDRALADRLRAGSLRAADRFSWARLAARHLAVYDALLGQSSPAPVA
jgi:glycosyltransferase involved in cell wall biosynthesis